MTSGLNVLSRCVFLVGLFVFFPSSQLARCEEKAEDSYWERVGIRRADCGVNCLYMFLRLHGFQVSYPDVSKACDNNHLGRSLLQLKNASAQFGVSASIENCASATGLQKLTLPAIAFSNASTLWTERETDGIGHFYLVLSADKEWIRYIDGTTGRIHTVPPEFYDRGTTGHVLVLQNSGKWSAVIDGLLSGICGALALWLACSVGSWAKNHFSRKTAQSAGTILIALLCLSPTPAWPQGKSIIDEANAASIWRDADRDGLNALYIFLRVHDVDVKYESLEHQIRSLGRPPSMLDLKNIGSSYGVSIELKKCHLDKQSDLDYPAITVVTDPRTNSKSFVVIFYGDSREINFVRAGFVRITSSSTDDFRRDWSGIVMVRSESSGQMAWSVVAMGAPSAALIAVYAWLRSTTRQRKMGQLSC